MDLIWPLSAIALAILALYALYRFTSRTSDAPLYVRQRQYIEHYTFPKPILGKLQAQHPHLSARQTQWVFEGLRQYFLIVLRVRAWRGDPVAMASRLVDDAWHAFIVTREYHDFCQQAFGTFLHHAPHTE